MHHADPLEPRTLFAAASTVPSGFAQQTITDKLNGPTTMAFAPDGRLFVAEQSGALRVIRGGKLLDRPFKTFTVDSRGERGLIGITFDPDFAINHYVYVCYTVPKTPTTPTFNRVARLVSNGDRAVPHSEQVVLDITPLSAATNHNGGAIHFGPDGKLYLSTGDNARQPASQELTNLHGKILRIFADGRIPKDNPFTKAKGVNKAIWAIGLRNPFNFGFDPMNGKMIINDVGAETFEEINEGVRGANYGWPDAEGTSDNPHYRNPIFYYAHGSGATKGEAIVGSAFYSPTSQTFPKDYAGDYFFADLSSGWIRRIDLTTRKVSSFASGIMRPVGLATCNDGSLYYLARGDGQETGTVVRIAAG